MQGCVSADMACLPMVSILSSSHHAMFFFGGGRGGREEVSQCDTYVNWVTQPFLSCEILV